MWARSSIATRCLRLAAALVLALVLAACAKKTEPAETQLMLAVATSLRNVTPALTKAYGERRAGVKIAATYGASGDLRKQVEGGAPIDAVIFASAKPVDELAAA